MTTFFVVPGGKVNNLLKINRLKRMEIKVIRNIITDAQKKHSAV